MFVSGCRMLCVVHYAINLILCPSLTNRKENWRNKNPRRLMMVDTGSEHFALILSETLWIYFSLTFFSVSFGNKFNTPWSITIRTEAITLHYFSYFSFYIRYLYIRNTHRFPTYAQKVNKTKITHKNPFFRSVYLLFAFFFDHQCSFFLLFYALTFPLSSVCVCFSLCNSLDSIVNWDQQFLLFCFSLCVYCLVVFPWNVCISNTIDKYNIRYLPNLCSFQSSNRFWWSNDSKLWSNIGKKPH